MSVPLPRKIPNRSSVSGSEKHGQTAFSKYMNESTNIQMRSDAAGKVGREFASFAKKKAQHRDVQIYDHMVARREPRKF